MEPVENKAEEIAARYVAIVESSQDAIIGKNLEGIVTSWNPAAEKIFGYAASEIIGQSINRIIPPERHGEEEKILAQIERGECVPHFETVRVRKDGSTLDVSVTVSPIKDAAGRIIGVSKLARDIRERKRMEADLHSAAQFPGENPYPVMRIDGRGTVLYANRACATWLADCPCKAGQPAPRVFTQAAVTALASRVVHEMEVVTGGRTFLFLCAPVPGSDYVNFYPCDITERKRAEEALRESEERFRTICENSPLGIVFTDLNLDTYYANEAQQRICGHPWEELAGQGWQATIHPDDHERVIREWQEVSRSGQPFRSERRYVHKDGKIVLASMTAAPIRDNAAVRGYVGIMEDISDRKQMEELLFESRERLNLALSSANIASFDWDIVNNKRIWDENVHRLLGTDPKTFKGTAEEFFRVIHPEDRAPMQEALSRAIETGTLTIEYRAVLPDGSIRHVSSRGKVHCDTTQHGLSA